MPPPASLVVRRTGVRKVMRCRGGGPGCACATQPVLCLDPDCTPAPELSTKDKSVDNLCKCSGLLCTTPAAMRVSGGRGRANFQEKQALRLWMAALQVPFGALVVTHWLLWTMAHHGPRGGVVIVPSHTERRLDTVAENRLNGGFCDAAGDHVCASPGLACPCRPRPQATCLQRAPFGRQLRQNQNRRTRRCSSLASGNPMRTIRGGHGTPAPAGVGRAKINQRVQHETYLPTFRYPPQAYPRFPRAHEDPRRPCRHQRSPRQGPQAPGNLRAGRPVRTAATRSRPTASLSGWPVACRRVQCSR